MRPLRVKPKNHTNPLDWERQIAANAAQLSRPNEEGSWILRLINLPANGAETIWDFTKTPEFAMVTVTRFLEPLRLWWENLGNVAEPVKDVPREISQSALPFTEPVVLEIDKGIMWGCRQGLESRCDSDHYFLYYVNYAGASRIASITDPFSQPYAENWQRLINRALGSGLLPPRRFVVDLAASR